jgi:Flp pilus assembly protein TadD
LKDNSKTTYNFLHNRCKEIIISLFLIAASLAVYWQIINHEFINYDDKVYVAENPHIKDGVTLESIRWAFTTDRAANWHPITWLSHILDIELYGLNPMGHHWMNLQIHIVNSILLFLVFNMMTGAIWKSAFVAALFALHPLHVESVAWVAERKDVLSAFFWILSIWAYARYTRQPDKKRYFLLIIFFVLGLMAKPMIVTLPFVLLLLDFWPLSRLQSTAQESKHFSYKALTPLVLEKLPLFVLTTVSSFITFFVQQQGGAVRSLEAVPLNLRIANTFFSYINYLAKTIWPQDFALIYPYPSISIIWQIILSVPVLLCISILTIKLAFRFPYLAIGWLWYLGTLVPVIGLVQVGYQSMADRYTYIPLIGIFIIVAWGMADISSRWRNQKNVLALLCCSVLALLMIRTWHQARYWQNSVTLLSHSLNVTHNNSMAHYVLGQSLNQHGKVKEAVFHYNEALKIRPKFAMAHNNLGVIMADQGNDKLAIYHFDKAIQIDYDLGGAHNNYATILLNQNKFEEAAKHYKEAISIDPENIHVYNNLANMLEAQEHFDEAVLYYKKVLSISAQNADIHYKLGCILIKQEKVNEALNHFAEAIKLNPDFVEVYNEAGIILARLGQFNKANAFFLKAIQIKPDSIEAKNNLLILKQMLTPDEK